MIMMDVSKANTLALLQAKPARSLFLGLMIDTDRDDNTNTVYQYSYQVQAQFCLPRQTDTTDYSMKHNI